MKDKLNQQILVSITPATIVKVIVVLLLFYLLFVIRDLVLVILTSIVIASAIEPGTQWFIKRRIPRVISVIIIYLLIILILMGIFAVFLPPLLDDVRGLASTIPDYLETISEGQFGGIPGLGSFLNSITANVPTDDILSSLGTGISGATFGFLTTASSVFGGLLSFLLIIVFSFYLAVQEDGVSNFLRIVVPLKKEKYVLDLWKRSRRKIGLWMQGQLLLGLIVGLLTYLGLSILGISNAMFLAVIAAMFELIPIFGPILAAIPAVGFALVDGGISLGLIVLGLYLVIQQFESQLIHPLVVKKIVGIPAMLAIIALIVGAKVAGFLGIIISVPVAAAFMEYLGDVEKRKVEEEKKLESTG